MHNYYVLLICFILSACSTQTKYVGFYPVDEKSFSANQSAKSIETFEPALLNKHYSAIGYVTSEHVLKKCPQIYGRCEVYSPEKPLVSVLEEHASKKGGTYITHAEKRYLKWVGKESRCVEWSDVVTGVDKDKKPITQRRCTKSEDYNVDYDTVVMHGLVWRKDMAFNTTEVQRLTQIATWKHIVKKYGENCLVVSPSAQAEYDSQEMVALFKTVFLKVHRHVMNKAGLGMIIDNTKFKEFYADVDNVMLEVPCKITK